MTHTSLSEQRGSLVIGDGFVASEAAPQNVFTREPEYVRVVFEFSQGDVAAVAKEPSQFPRCMAVIESQSLSPIVTPANVTMGMARDDGRLRKIQAILAHRFLDIAPKRVAPIPAAVALAGLLDILRAVRPLATGAARLALRFSTLLGYIVHAKFVDRVDVSASATGFLFHPKPHSRIAGFRRAEKVL